jgi:predicted dehydrogenase
MRIAIVESTHWHAPLYLDALEDPGVRVVGLTDSAQQTGAALAKRFGCEVYRDLDELLDTQDVDFAFVFGRHIDMPVLAGKLIARGIPFALEKPCGIHASDVESLAASAEAKNLYVAVPMIFRLSDTLDIVGQTKSRPEFASIRFMVGPPSRYEAAGTPWMLKRELAGGGPLINVGVHFIDLFYLLAQEDVESVSAVSSSEINRLPIEDFISIRMVTKENRVCTLECGYIFPSGKRIQREFSFSIRSPDAYYVSGDDRSRPMVNLKHGKSRLASKPMYIIHFLFAGFSRKLGLDRCRSLGSAMRPVRSGSWRLLTCQLRRAARPCN